MNNFVVNNRQARFALYVIGGFLLCFAAKGIGAGTTAAYSLILGTTIVVALADAAMPTIQTIAKSAFISLLRVALPYVAKYIRPEEVVASVGTAQGISVGALNAAVESKGVFGLNALRAILAGAETDTASLRAMVRGVALAVIGNGWKFTAITEAEQLAATAETLKQVAADRKGAHQQARDEQVRRIDDQLQIKLLGEDEIIAQQNSILTDVSPLLGAAPAELKQWVN